MSFYKTDNFYLYSTQLLKSRLFYSSKKFSPKFFVKAFKTPLLGVSVKLSVKWSQRDIYFVWDLLRTIFYFKRYFLKNPSFMLYNRKYVKLEMKFASTEVGFKDFLSYTAHFKTLRPKLITKNYLTKRNEYILNFHESQFQLPLPKYTVFDFYNWKTKVPIIFFPISPKLEKNGKYQLYFTRLYYVQFYRQLFNYRNLKFLNF